MSINLTNGLPTKNLESNWQDILPPSLGLGKEGYNQRLQYLTKVLDTVFEERSRSKKSSGLEFRTFVAKKIHEISEFDFLISQELSKIFEKNKKNNVCPEEYGYLLESTCSASTL